MTDTWKENHTGSTCDLVAECFFAENSINSPAHPESSRVSIQRRTGPRNGKRLIEVMIETEDRTTDVMQSMARNRKNGGHIIIS
jgi:hypothetical protein